MARIFLVVIFSLLIISCAGDRNETKNEEQKKVQIHKKEEKSEKKSNEVIWNFEELMAYCPRCVKPIEMTTPLCPSCKIVLIWNFPNFPNTPEGLITKIKIATLYRNKQLLLDSFSKAYRGQIEYEIGSRFNNPPTIEERQGILEKVVKSVEVQNNSGKIYFSDDKKSFYEIIYEDNEWRITLREYMNEKVKINTVDSLSRLKEGIEKYYKKYRLYPKGGNAELVKTLIDEEIFELKSTDILKGYEIYDYWGNAIIYREKSQIKEKNQQNKYNEAFDLYSIGPNQIDEYGSGDDVLP